jgi:hypothetical protein
MKRPLFIIAVILAGGLLLSCESRTTADVRTIAADVEAVFALAQEEPPKQVEGPQVDSLVATFKGMSVAIKYNRPDVFIAFLDPHAEGKLQMATQRFGYTSLKNYLVNQSGVWPDPDTLLVTDLVTEDEYARLTFIGYGRGSSNEMYRYTFALFRRTDHGWRLSALSWLEKPSVDRYGYPVTYHETELPPSLRFPRFF